MVRNTEGWTSGAGAWGCSVMFIEVWSRVDGGSGQVKLAGDV